jgi:hypothetical protein
VSPFTRLQTGMGRIAPLRFLSCLQLYAWVERRFGSKPLPELAGETKGVDILLLACMKERIGQGR